MSELNIIQFPFLFQLIETEYGSKYARKKSRSVNYSYANQNPIYTPISRYQFLSLIRSQHAQLWWFSLSVRLIFDLNYFTLDQLVQYQLAHDHTFSLCIARIQRHSIELKLPDRKEFHTRARDRSALLQIWRVGLVWSRLLHRSNDGHSVDFSRNYSVFKLNTRTTHNVSCFPFRIVIERSTFLWTCAAFEPNCFAPNQLGNPFVNWRDEEKKMCSERLLITQLQLTVG